MNNFTLLGHWAGDNFTYELQIEQENKVIMFPFKSGLIKPQKISTLAEARKVDCPCKTMGDVEGFSRLYGEFSEPIERTKDWMNFEGVTKNKREVYKALEKGKVEVLSMENGAEFNFESENLKGRWLLRTLPNVFDNKFIDGPNMQLFWKPGDSSKIKTEASEGTPFTINTEMQQSITLEGNEFTTVVAAEGRWIDRFGQPFIYTKEFVRTLFTKMSDQIKKGEVGVDKQHNKIDNGKMTKLQLLEEPYAHIVGRGFYNGNIGDVNGASIDAELDVLFDKNTRSYVPVNGVTKRVSLVASPACKVCQILKK